MSDRSGVARRGVRLLWSLATVCGLVVVGAAPGDAAAVSCSVSRQLAQTTSGAEVACLEARLQELGYQTSYVDSYYGTVTVAAVKRLQASVSLPQTGIADPATLSALGIYSQAVRLAPTCRISAAVRATETSAAAACVEQALSFLGFQSTYLDSYYGTVTVSSVAALQRSKALPVNGSLVDYATAVALGIWTGPAPVVPVAPSGCLQYPTTPDADGVWIVNPNQYQRVAATSEVGSKGPIIVIGDSLTWMTAKETAMQLRASGWGPVCVSGTIAASVQFGNAQIPDGLDSIARIRASSTVWQGSGPKVVVALGTNDVGFSGTSLSSAKSYVSNMLAAIGPTEEPVAWMTVRTKRLSPWPARESTFNQAIAESGVQVMPWAAEFQNAFCGSDKVHLVSAGKVARVALYGRL